MRQRRLLQIQKQEREEGHRQMNSTSQDMSGHAANGQFNWIR